MTSSASIISSFLGFWRIWLDSASGLGELPLPAFHLQDALQIGKLLVEGLFRLGRFAGSFLQFESRLVAPEVMSMPLAEFDGPAVRGMDWKLEEGATFRELVAGWRMTRWLD